MFNRLELVTSLVFAIAAAGCSISKAESPPMLEHEHFSGAQLSNIIEAWQTVQREYNPPAALSEFEVHYTEARDIITVTFFKPNTIVEGQGSRTIRQDSLYYQAVIEAGRIRAFSGPSPDSPR
jgi:hypothetical protein